MIAFDRQTKGLTGIVVKGFLLSLITFGIYRFWYITNLRRYFWSRTVVAGSPGEYTGRGKELFLGFLVALAILVPVYLVLFAISFAVPSLAALAGPISFIFLFFLGQYAVYRGRRYRASRTLWRGIRLSQDGSAITYVGLALGWWLLTIVTLGIAFPWMRASLERYRINHTLIGESRMASTATGGMIVKPWLLLYVVGLGPLLISVLAFLIANKFSIPSDMMIPDPHKPGQLIFNPVYAGTPLARYGTVVGIVSAIFIPLAVLLFPYYRARETRAFMNAAALGASRLHSSLRARQFYWPYIIYFLTLIGFFVVFAIVVGIAMVIVASGGGDGGTFSGMHWLILLLIVPLYLAMLLAFAVLAVRIITVRLWRAVTDSTTFENVEALDAVLASSRRTASGLNEGLADALDVGGAIEIGF
ncbi:membrane protein [Methylobacterium gnaphalii]|uniref:Membrane protein n=1 Tax=Methylobacterium gnaphalii TaxID=1010610 RepID=A0A512JEG3_9HYPH|nr:membrane protein [Methylobacterium gnaphalii]GLS51034.1 membrane protein [Methylobacterium gnaphalii]